LSINAHDLVVLHMNINRMVGNEIFANNTLANNDQSIIISVEKLIKEGVLRKTNQFEISIHKIKLTELKEILKESYLKRSGTKKDLINRIRENFNYIHNLELPFVYIATEKGEKLLQDTEYLLSFINDPISIVRAHYLVENYINENCNDKVAEVFKFEFQRKYENGTMNAMYNHELESLISHYKNDLKDYNSARKYLNLLYYFKIKNILNDLETSKYSYYDLNGNLDLDRLQIKLNHHRVSIYEHFIFTQRLSNDNIFNLFIKDTEGFNDLYEELTKRYIDYIIAAVKKENEPETFMGLMELLKTNHTISKEEFEETYNNNSHIITTDIESLIEMKSQIEVDINIESGKMNFYLDNDSLEKLINEIE